MTYSPPPMKTEQKPHLHEDWIDPHAKEIVANLQYEGFTTYLVGGCVRDLLIGIHPKDYDIATTARPQQIKKRIRGSYIIGRRFRLVLVRRGEKQFEIATFRREGTLSDLAEDNPVENKPVEDNSADDSFIEDNSTEDTSNEEIIHFGENFFGNPQQDALRRDFTVNALFFDPVKNKLIDYANGMADIFNRTIRMIGDPDLRIKEDPIRSLRALRFSHRVGFKLEESLRASIQKLAHLVGAAILPRRREEYLKIMRLPFPSTSFLEMEDLGFFEHLFPHLKPLMEDTSRREIFYDYLEKANEACHHDPMDTVENYLPLILAFDRSAEGLNKVEELRLAFMRDDLGMFKAEQSEVSHVIRLSEKLTFVDQFKKRGYRRQKSFLEQSYFYLAFRIAKFEKLLRPEQIYFWEEQIKKHFGENF